MIPAVLALFSTALPPTAPPPTAPPPTAPPPAAPALLAPRLPAPPPAAASLFALRPAPVQFSGVADVRFSVLVGLRDLNSDLAPADEHDVLGIALHVREPTGLVGFELGYQYSRGDGSEDLAGVGRVSAKSSIHELWSGARWTFEPFGPHLRPYLGAGLSLLRASYEVSGQGDSDSDSALSLGLYGHAGIDYELGSGWSVGLDARALFSNTANLQEDVTLDYVQAGVTLGWAW